MVSTSSLLIFVSNQSQLSVFFNSDHNPFLKQLASSLISNPSFRSSLVSQLQLDRPSSSVGESSFESPGSFIHRLTSTCPKFKDRSNEAETNHSAVTPSTPYSNSERSLNCEVQCASNSNVQPGDLTGFLVGCDHDNGLHCNGGGRSRLLGGVPERSPFSPLNDLATKGKVRACRSPMISCLDSSDSLTDAQTYSFGNQSYEKQLDNSRIGLPSVIGNVIDLTSEEDHNAVPVRISSFSCKRMNNFELNISAADIFELISSVATGGDGSNSSVPSVVLRYKSACPADKSKIYQDTIACLQEVLQKGGLEQLSKINGMRVFGGKKVLATQIADKVFPDCGHERNTDMFTSNSPYTQSIKDRVNQSPMILRSKRKINSSITGGAYHPKNFRPYDKKTIANTYLSISQYKFVESVCFDEFSAMVMQFGADLCCEKDLLLQLSEMRLDQLIDFSSEHVPFDKQVLVILRQNTKSTGSCPSPDHNRIFEVIGIARNSDMNAYCTSRLDICLHLSCSFAQFYLICHRLTDMQTGREATITFIPSLKPSFSSRDGKTVVFNATPGVKNVGLEELRVQMECCLSQGLLSNLKCNEGSRSSNTSKKKSPVLHTGFTTSNCADYSSHRQTQIGHTNPSLIASYFEDASDVCRQEYGKAIAIQNCLFKDSPDAFGLKNMHPLSPSLSRMQKEYCSFFRLDELKEHSKIYCKLLRNTATTALVNNHINKHYDKLNDTADGNCSLISCSILLDRRKYESSLSMETKQWLDQYGYTDTIPFCNLNYSRSVCTNAGIRPDSVVKDYIESKDPARDLKKAIMDSITDTSSITNYASTFENLKGIGFSCVENAINDFSESQMHMYEILNEGNWRQVYGQCLRTMGDYVHDNVEDAMSVLQEKGMGIEINWRELCLGNHSQSDNIPVVMDPSHTYQGPKISLTASYDINRYHSLNVDAYRDILSNLGGMNKENKLAFSVFASVQCNSTLPVAELLRHLAGDNWAIRKLFHGNKYKNSFWDMAVDVANHTKFKQVGSSREQRFQISGQGEVFNFHKYKEDLLSNFSRFWSASSSQELYSMFDETVTWLKSNVRNIGHVIAIKLLQLSSLIGLLPLEVSTFASVEGGGPGKLLKLFFHDPKTAFLQMHEDLSQVWGPRLTKAYLENLLCELYRELQATSGKNRCFKKFDIRHVHTVNGVAQKKLSTKKDHVVMYSHRGVKNSMSNMFRTSLDSRGKWQLEVQSFEINPKERKVSKRPIVAVPWIDDRSLDHLYFKD